MQNLKEPKTLRSFSNSQDRREFLEKKLKVKLNPVGIFSFAENLVQGHNIENLIGAAQVPMGVAGPITVLDSNSRRREIFYIPLATTEGALVASISRGCKAINQSEGAKILIENVGITRGPVFATDGIVASANLKNWIKQHFKLLADLAKTTSSHLSLLKVESSVVGKNLFVRFYFDTVDAMGMNMATIATQAITDQIEKETKVRCASIAGNFDTDKKSSQLNFISGRGRRAHAEAILNKEVVQSVLKTTPEKITDLVYRKCQIGSAMSGSTGFNAHYANIIAAIFIACGQDCAHIVEGSQGITTAELLADGSLYFSTYLPSLIVGSLGGGTGLPTQKEALQIMKAYGGGKVERLARGIAAAVLAGELSLIASQAEGSLTKAHQRYGRNIRGA